MSRTPEEKRAIKARLEEMTNISAIVDTEGKLDDSFTRKDVEAGSAYEIPIGLVMVKAIEGMGILAGLPYGEGKSIQAMATCMGKVLMDIIAIEDPERQKANTEDKLVRYVEDRTEVHFKEARDKITEIESAAKFKRTGKSAPKKKDDDEPKKPKEKTGPSASDFGEMSIGAMGMKEWGDE